MVTAKLAVCTQGGQMPATACRHGCKPGECVGKGAAPPPPAEEEKDGFDTDEEDTDDLEDDEFTDGEDHRPDPNEREPPDPPDIGSAVE